MSAEGQATTFPDEKEFDELLAQFKIAKRKHHDDWDFHLLEEKLNAVCAARILAMTSKNVSH